MTTGANTMLKGYMNARIYMKRLTAGLDITKLERLLRKV
jgi:hypothetical protein